MGNWLVVWTVVLTLTLLVFSVLVVVVALGGWSDIKAMFRALDADDDGDES